MINEAISTIPSRDTIITTIRNNATTTNNKSIGIPFVITYTPDISDCTKELKEALVYTEAAYADPHFPLIMGGTKRPLLSFQRGKNLRELVTSSALT